MPKFLQSGALFALTLLALAPLAARADEVMFRGQKIEYGGASEVTDIGYGIISGNERSCECLAAGVARR